MISVDPSGFCPWWWRARETRPMDTVAFWVKLLSLEFPWLCSITSQGKAIVLSYKHNHMRKVCVYIHP